MSLEFIKFMGSQCVSICVPQLDVIEIFVGFKFGSMGTEDSFCSVTGGFIWRLLLLTSRRAQGGPLTLQKYWSSDLSFASLTFSATVSRSVGDRSYPTCRLTRSGPVVSFSLNKLSMTESRFCLLWKLTFIGLHLPSLCFSSSNLPSL